MELAVDFFKKQKRDTVEGVVVAALRYKVGNPYKVGGVWYYPERDLTYDETELGLGTAMNLLENLQPMVKSLILNW